MEDKNCIYINNFINLWMSDGFRITRNCGGDSCPHSGRLSEEEFRTEEEEQGTWEGKSCNVRLVINLVFPPHQSK